MITPIISMIIIVVGVIPEVALISMSIIIPIKSPNKYSLKNKVRIMQVRINPIDRIMQIRRRIPAGFANLT